jgi:hypothetical protein
MSMRGRETQGTKGDEIWTPTMSAVAGRALLKRVWWAQRYGACRSRCTRTTTSGNISGPPPRVDAAATDDRFFVLIPGRGFFECWAKTLDKSISSPFSFVDRQPTLFYEVCDMTRDKGFPEFFFAIRRVFMYTAKNRFHVVCIRAHEVLKMKTVNFLFRAEEPSEGVRERSLGSVWQHSFFSIFGRHPSF